MRPAWARATLETKRAVEAGYWALYRYNPLLKDDGKKSVCPGLQRADRRVSRNSSKGEVRYSALLQQFPETAEGLFAKAERDARERLDTYKRLAAQ